MRNRRRLVGNLLGLTLSAGSLNAAEPASEGFLQTPDGLRLYYRVAGHGLPVAIVPFASLLAADFEPLAAKRTLIFYDMRGRGRSDPAPAGDALGIDQEVRDLETVRKHFDVEHPALVGFSYLGAVVALYAAEHRNRVARLVQIAPLAPRGDRAYAERASPAAFVDADATRRLEAFQDSGEAVHDPARHCRLFWRAFLPAYTASSATAQGFLPRMIGRTCGLPNEQPTAMLATVTRVLAGLEGRDWRHLAARITAPTLVIYGSDDHVVPAAGARDWAEAIPGARLRRVDDAGHIVWADRPQVLLDAVDMFLADASDGGHATIW